MERDFLGLNSKDSVVVKDEAVDNESGFSKYSAVRWSAGADGFDGLKNRQAGETQNNITKKAVPISVSHPSFYGTQFGGATINQHGVTVPSVGSFLAGTTEPWYNNSKTSYVPAQLTILYNGMVNVYDDISPEKAQAIMFLAGNGASASTPQARVNLQPCSAISSPMSVSSHSMGPTNIDEGVKTVKGPVAYVSKADSPRGVSSLEDVEKSAVPQARKASLARFFEKRKERVMSSAPYNATKDSSNMNAVAAAEN